MKKFSRSILNCCCLLVLSVFLSCNNTDSKQEVLESPEVVSVSEDTITVFRDEKIDTEPAVAGDKVIGIKDGDTIELLRNGKSVTVRLQGVDTPERKQAFGEQAKKFTSDLVFGEYVNLIVHNTDRYGRTVGTIILPDGRSLNEELVKNGFAWHYVAYSKDTKLANLEADARRFKRGLWADPNPIAPWDYRKGIRSGSTNPLEKTTETSSVKNTDTVWLCNSKGSSVYHVRRNCSGLDRCKSEIIAVTKAQAVTQYKRRAAKDCQ